MAQKQDHILEALVQNYNFKREKPGKLPTIDYVYPDYTADGNTEAFRFDSGLKSELSDRAKLVRQSLADKQVTYTLDESILLEVGKIAPRLGLKEIIKGEINSVYSTYKPLLLIGVNEEDFAAYVIKPVIDGSMAWFELTKDEAQRVRDNLTEKVEAKPYRTLLQKIFG